MCVIITVIPSMLCFLSFQNISYRFLWCFQMLLLVLLRLLRVFLLSSPIAYFRYCDLQVKTFLLASSLQAKLSSKSLLSPPGWIQIYMTAKKRKQSEVVCTCQLTTKQIFMWKAMFLYEVRPFFYLLFQTTYWYNFPRLWTLWVNNSGKTALLKKNSICGKICCQKFSSNDTVLTYSCTFFTK